MTTPDPPLLDAALVLLPFVGVMGGVLILAMLLSPIVAGLQAWWCGENVREAMRLWVHTEIYPLPGVEKETTREH